MEAALKETLSINVELASPTDTSGGGDPVLYPLTREDDGLHVDFMATVHGLRSFEGVRDRATAMDLAGSTIRVASLADIIRSKRAAGRDRDRAVLGILEKTHAQASVTPSATGRARQGKRPRRG